MIETPRTPFHHCQSFRYSFLLLILQESENDITNSPLQNATWKDLMFLSVTRVQKGNALMLTIPNLSYPSSREGTILLYSIDMLRGSTIVKATSSSLPGRQQLYGNKKTPVHGFPGILIDYLLSVCSQSQNTRNVSFVCMMCLCGVFAHVCGVVCMCASIVCVWCMWRVCVVCLHVCVVCMCACAVCVVCVYVPLCANRDQRKVSRFLQPSPPSLAEHGAHVSQL